jgi:chromosome segregation ATPase
MHAKDALEPPLTFALQALLIRHEAYVADSERERRQMVATIENLEKEKLELEASNAQTIKANRDLLDQLENLNEAAINSDAQIQALEDTLRSTEEELERLGSSNWRGSRRNCRATTTRSWWTSRLPSRGGRAPSRL